jgi:hypothetical protein
MTDRTCVRLRKEHPALIGRIPSTSHVANSTVKRLKDTRITWRETELRARMGWFCTGVVTAFDEDDISPALCFKSPAGTDNSTQVDRLLRKRAKALGYFGGFFYPRPKGRGYSHVL